MNRNLPYFNGIESSPELNDVYTYPEVPGKEFYMPERLDLMVTGRCILRCEGCWGPTHNSIEPEMTPEQWIDIIDYIDLNNRSDRFSSSILASYRARVCITGGEPLMYGGIVNLAESLDKQGTPTTLSTTGYDPDVLLPSILPHINELGVPVDGPSPEDNSLWRKGKLTDGGLESAIGALLLAQRDYEEVRLTVRTVVHKDNLTSIPEIPEMLTDSGLRLDQINWKFYLHNSNTGPRAEGESMQPPQESLERLADQVAEFEGNFRSLSTLTPAMPQDRLVINHNGECYIVARTLLSATKDIHVGNLLTNPSEVIKVLNEEHATFVAGACSRSASFMLFDLIERVADVSDAPIDDAQELFYKMVNSVFQD